MVHTDNSTTHCDSSADDSETVDRLKTLLTAHRKRETRFAEQIARLETDLADLRSSVAAAAGQLRRLSSRYTVVLGPDSQIENAERLYGLLTRDARQIGQELSLSLPMTPPRQPITLLP